ncbi:unnamed protein product [Sphagnum troendelagicum]|uniref:Uncharacterized protein n=1 Tax=Sphagnum troendelagicum TaxID=128251 RepID=A0ABP0TBM1_9BRYO
MHFFSTPFFPELVQITHVMHLVAQAAVHYAMGNPGSYAGSNIAQLITDSACFLGTLAGAPFSELDQTDQPASLYAGTKKAGEEIAHEYI